MPVSRNLVLQVFVNKPNNRFLYNENLFDFSKYQAKQYAVKYNADYYQHTGPRYLPNEEICFEKFIVWHDMFSKYDKIFYLDMDAVITKSCPNIFEYNDFSARPESEYKNIDTLKLRFIKNNYHRYFNSGVMLFTKDFLDKTRDQHLKIINIMKPKYNSINEKLYDQMLFNQLVSETYNKYNNLDDKWNSVPKKHKKMNPEKINNNFIIHYIQTRKQFFDLTDWI